MIHRKGKKNNWTDLSLLGQEPTFKINNKAIKICISGKESIRIIDDKCMFSWELIKLYHRY